MKLKHFMYSCVYGDLLKDLYLTYYLVWKLNGEYSPCDHPNVVMVNLAVSSSQDNPHKFLIEVLHREMHWCGEGTDELVYFQSEVIKQFPRLVNYADNIAYNLFCNRIKYEGKKYKQLEST